MTQTDDEVALPKAICAHPDEDTPRLMYADWLDEQGGVPCPECHGKRHFYKLRDELPPERHYLPLAFGPKGNPMVRKDCGECKGAGTVPNPRAEFIRVQVELAQPSDIAADGVIVRRHVLLGRETALLERHRAAWSRVPCPNSAKWPNSRTRKAYCTMCHGTDNALAGKEVTFRRGFVHEAKGCRLEDVYEQPPCLTCADHEAYYNTPGQERDAPCPNCNGNERLPWQPTAWAVAVFRAHPTIERVPLVDRAPYPDISLTLGTSQTFNWHSAVPHDGTRTALVPQPLFDVMKAKRPRNITPMTRGEALEHISAHVANDALAEATADVLREFATR